jgi:hypothetical protein
LISGVFLQEPVRTSWPENRYRFRLLDGFEKFSCMRPYELLFTFTYNWSTTFSSRFCLWYCGYMNIFPRYSAWDNLT